MIERNILSTQEDRRPPTLITPRAIPVQQVKAAAAEVVSAQDGADFQIRLLAVINVSGGPSTIDIYYLQDGDSADATTIIDNGVNVSDGETIYVFDETRYGYLEPGGSIWAACSTDDDCNIYGWGYDYRGAYG